MSIRKGPDELKFQSIFSKLNLFMARIDSYKMSKHRQILVELIKQSDEIKRWVLKGGMSILDLIIYSGSMFLVSVLLGRWLDIGEYGVYALAMSFVSLFYQIQNALILEPMSVIGPSFYPDSIPNYLSRQRKLHFWILIPLGIFISLGAYFYRVIGGNPSLANVLILLGLLAAIIQLPWLIRRSFYVISAPNYAVFFSLIFSIILVGSTIFFQYKGLLTSSSVLLLISFASLAALASVISKLKGSPNPSDLPGNSILWKQNWGFGRWMLLTGIIMVIAGQTPIILSGMIIDEEASGVIKAMQNFMLPMGMIISTLLALAVPILAGDSRRIADQELYRKMKLVATLLISMAGFYTLFLAIFSVPLEYLLYQGKYADYSYLIPLWGMVPFLMSFATVPSIRMKLNQTPQGILMAAFVWMLVTLLTCIPFTRLWGLLGTTVSTLIGYIASSMAYFIIAGRIKKNEAYNRPSS